MPSIQRMVELRIRDEVRIEMLIAERKEPDYTEPQIWMVAGIGSDSGQSVEQLQLKALEAAKLAILQQIADLTPTSAEGSD